MADKHFFNKKLIDAILEVGTKRMYEKKQSVLKEGEIERHVYIIESGAVRLSLLSEMEDQSIRFGYKGQMICSLPSYLNGTPSEFSIETIRKTTLYAASKSQIEEIIYRDSDSMKGYIGLLENLVTDIIEREVDLLTNSPIERLNRVMKRNPLLFQEIPLKYIASYFRMTPETLSRIRNS